MNSYAPTAVPQAEIERQLAYIDKIAVMSRDFELRTGQKPRAYTQTFGCQQNEADTEHIAGMLHDMGYEKTENIADADVLIYNTCAVREHAESRALGNIGALSHLKNSGRKLRLACAAAWCSRSMCRIRLEKVTLK